MSSLYIVGTADTKGEELNFLRAILADSDAKVILVDVGTRTASIKVDVTANSVASFHPEGPGAALGTDDRGTAVAAMSAAFGEYCASNASDIAAIIGIGGGGGTSIITAGMRSLPLATPKVMVSTLASGNTAAFVGVSDIIMVPTITDLAGLNRVTRKVLHNAAQALLGMASHPSPPVGDDKTAIGLTMFGVTTPCILAASQLLSEQFDPLIFHATGTGGQAMEHLAAQGEISGMLDLTLTEICDFLFGGVLPCLSTRLDVVSHANLPWVGAVGALDMVNFWAPTTVPTALADRLFYHHNPNVTLMRTTPAENAKMGAWIAGKLNSCGGPVRLLIPEKGVSSLDIEGGAFWDSEANAALFEALESNIETTDNRQVVRVPHHINDPEFAQLAVETFLKMFPDE